MKNFILTTLTLLLIANTAFADRTPDFIVEAAETFLSDTRIKTSLLGFDTVIPASGGERTAYLNAGAKTIGEILTNRHGAATGSLENMNLNIGVQPSWTTFGYAWMEFLEQFKTGDDVRRLYILAGFNSAKCLGMSVSRAGEDSLVKFPNGFGYGSFVRLFLNPEVTCKGLDEDSRGLFELLMRGQGKSAYNYMQTTVSNGFVNSSKMVAQYDVDNR